jgi:hypothetical protein
VFSEPQNNAEILTGIKRKPERKSNEPIANSSCSCSSKSKHSEMKNRLEEYFCRKPDEICIQQKSFFNITAVSSKALAASYQESYRIAQKKPHMTAETVILPAATDMVHKQCSVENVLSSFVTYHFK